MKKALVLTGGSIRGAFQAGAIEAIIKNNFEPDIIRGISAGALNASYLTSAYGKHKDFPIATKELIKLWTTEITSTDDLIRKRYLKGIIGALFNRFTSLVDNKPLKKIIDQKIDSKLIQNSDVDFAVGAVNINSGQMEYVDKHSNYLKEYITASAAIPVVMPASKINGDFYYDGGIRDSAPLNSAITAGAEEIIVISCSPVGLHHENLNPKNAVDLINRVIDIFFNEMLMNDLSKLRKINEKVRQGKSNKKLIKYKLISPSQSLSVKLTKFNSQDIREMLDQGFLTALDSQWYQ